MPQLHLTDVVVQRLHTVGIYYDTTTPAFGIRVGKNRKAWIVTRGKNRERITIDRYPAMSLADARKAAKKLLAEEATPRGKIKFGEAYEGFKEAISTKKERTQRDYKRVIEKYLLPVFEKRKLGTIAYEEITAITDKLAPSEKGHCLSVGRNFFRWCVRPPRRYIPHSPLEGVQVVLGKKRKRVLASAELKPVWRASQAQGYPHGTIVQLLILNGQRRSETANLRWPWINEKDRTITLPDWLTKNGKEHTFPYGDMTAAVLEGIPRRNSTDLLFPSKVSDKRPISGWSKYKKELDTFSGVKGHTLHDLRRTFRTMHAEIGTPAHIGERLINHLAAVQTDVEAIYDRYKYLPEMREAVGRYEAQLSNLLAA